MRIRKSCIYEGNHGNRNYNTFLSILFNLQILFVLFNLEDNPKYILNLAGIYARTGKSSSKFGALLHE